MLIETKELFKEWLQEIPENLRYFVDEFAPKNNLKLDFTVESLDVLEKWILAEYEYPIDLKEDDEIFNLLTIYIGEVYMKFLGGEWYVDFNINSKYPKRIAILLDPETMESKYPSILCTSAISRKKGKLFSSTLKKSLENKD